MNISLSRRASLMLAALGCACPVAQASVVDDGKGSTFALANERAWVLRYDYNFAALGIPGLTFNVRYVKGDRVDPQRIATAKGRALQARDGEGKEWERTTDITYVVQSGVFRNVSLRWRNASMRSNFADAADENRVIVGYTFDF